MAKSKTPITVSHPEVADQWNYRKNGEHTPDKYTRGSSKKFSWICDLGHEWITSVSKRTAGQGCPVCKNRVLLAGFNDCATTAPKTVKLWNYSKNPEYILDSVFAGSRDKCHWKCPKGHEWIAEIRSLAVNGSDCPVCDGQRPDIGVNDLLTIHPDIIIFIDPKKNEGINITNLMPKSSKELHFQCPDDDHHQWLEPVAKMTRRGVRCPLCIGTKVVTGINDLPSLYPEVADLWNSEKNEIGPDGIRPSLEWDERKWWKCDKGHEWFTSVRQMTSVRDNKRLCLECYSPWSEGGSKGERDLLDMISRSYILGGYDILTNNRYVISPFEIDIYIPELKLGIEYNGLYWHSEKNSRSIYQHYNKWKKCKDKGVELIAVWEDDWEDNPENIIRMIESWSINSITSNDCVNFNEKVQHRLLENNDSKFYVNYGGEEYYIKLRDNSYSLEVIDYNLPIDNLMVFKLLTKNVEHYARENNIPRIEVETCNSSIRYNPFKDSDFYQFSNILPSFKYLVNRKRVDPDTKLMNEEIKKNDNLKVVHGVSHRELADINKFDRIWDYGRTLWIKDIVH